MNSSPAGAATPAPKLLAGGAAKLRLAAISGTILIAGAVLEPRTLPTASTAEDRAAPLLEEQVETRSAGQRVLSATAAARARDSTVGILAAPAPSSTWPTRTDYSRPPEKPSAAGFGVSVSDRLVLTHEAALSGRPGVSLATSTGQSLDATVVTYDGATGLVLLRAARPDLHAAPISAARPEPGAPAVGVGVDGKRFVMAPVFVTSVDATRYTVSPAEGIRPGMPLYTPGGELFAVATGDEHAALAIAIEGLVERLIALAASGAVQAAFGLGFQPSPSTVGEAGGGVLINEVLPGGPADTAGVKPGDVLLAIDDTDASSLDAAARALGSRRPGSPAALRLQRGARTVTVTATAASSYELAALSRARRREPVNAPRAGDLFSAEVLELAAVPPEARVLSVNGHTVASRADVERETRRARAPVPVLVRAGGRQFFATIQALR